ncbi:competence protein CoiA family protein [Roseomonas genomospecies 6]|uniref:Competence protein CoiA nuclease-like domain-containing protein n=1 Tax=Roseomonas genomospecies 6 TaxID=214106 RepID=A0A9W7NJC6_9PROT|nr:competence protein CoiA family protein [Roseomonas genomospecies 6]KAA0680352.1 hypothetical protein DS843_13645 [Roseomonas genomospecies 6]
MPFLCYDAADSLIHAGRCSAEEWVRLQSGWRALGLRMTCCPAAAIPVTLETGTRFFRHHLGEDCGSEGESVEHQAAKAEAAIAAAEAGWTVQVEGQGFAPSGEEWRADVLCERGEERVAVEIQMSRQSLDEYARRQALYAASGVRGMWLVGHAGFDRRWATAELPAIHIEFDGLKASAALGQRSVLRQPLGEFVKEYLAGRWYCRRPLKVPAVLIPELTACLDCGRAIRAGRVIAAFPGEADDRYPSRPIFSWYGGYHKDEPLKDAAWEQNGIIALEEQAEKCPYCRGRLAPVRYGPEAMLKGQHPISSRHGTIRLDASGWWRTGEPLLPRGWVTRRRPATGRALSVAEIIKKQDDKLPDNLRQPMRHRRRACQALLSAIDGLTDWESSEGRWRDSPEGRWLPDVVVEETMPNQGGRRIAYFLALGEEALESRRKHALLAKAAGFEALLLNPTSRLQQFTDHPTEIVVEYGDEPSVTLAGTRMPLERFAADFVRSQWVQRTYVTVPYSSIPEAASCPSCGRTGTTARHVALHFGEADIAFGDDVVVLPISALSSRAVYPIGRRHTGGALSRYCVCGANMTSNLPSEVVIADYSDIQVRNGRMSMYVGPWVRRGSVPTMPEALGVAEGSGGWTPDDWLRHVARIAPPPEHDALMFRHAALGAIEQGARAAAGIVDVMHVEDGVVLVRNRSEVTAVALLSTMPGSGADDRVRAEIEALSALVKKAGVTDTYWFSPLPHLPHREHRFPVVSIGQDEQGMWAAPTHDGMVMPLDGFVAGLLDGEWENVGTLDLAVVLVPEQVRCACGEVSIITPWCAATPVGRHVPTFAPTLGAKGAGTVSIVDSETLRARAHRHLKVVPYVERPDGTVAQPCRRCGRDLLSALTPETLLKRWAGAGSGQGVKRVSVNRWCRVGEAILVQPWLVAGKPSTTRQSVEEWLSKTAPQQALF